MAKKARVFLGENDIARLVDTKNCKSMNQNCYLCDLLDCQLVQQNGEKTKIGVVKLFGKKLSVYFSPTEGCWLPYPA